MEEVSFLAFVSVASCAILYWSFLVHSLLTKLGIKRGIVAVHCKSHLNLPHVHSTVALFSWLNLVGT
jgi:hypothetical protein